MEATNYSCKILIVGGSVAGLALANMLERVGIDFVVLEAGRDAIRNGIQDLDNHVSVRHQQGNTIFEFDGLADPLQKRHGYPVVFVERQTLLRTLYDNMQNKHKVLLQKRFVKLEYSDDKVVVTTQDGCTYEGDALVGADGMHSPVRKEMHRLAHKLSPGYFDKDEYSLVPCLYKCIWGISHPTPSIESGSIHVVMGKDHSYSLFTGREKLYWFLYVKNASTMHGKQVPRYTADDEQQLAEQYFEDRFSETVTFGDVYKNKMVASLTPLHEYQWKRWHFGRIMTIGDACHKVHPLGGSRGGAAVEDGAVLVNALLQRLRRSPSRKLSTSDFDNIFSKAQADQEYRSRRLVDSATEKQKVDAMQGIFAPLAVKFIIPNLTDDQALAMDSARAVTGQRIEALPVPVGDRYVPYNDELPAKPLQKTSLMVNSCFAGFQLLLSMAAYVPLCTLVSWISIFRGLLHENYLESLVHHLVQARENSSINRASHFMLSLILLTPVSRLWSLEGFRRGNLGSLWSWPITLFLTAGLAIGEAPKVIPLYFLFSMLNSSRTIFTFVTGRPVPLAIANVMVPVTLGIYAVEIALYVAVVRKPVDDGYTMAMGGLLPTCAPVIIRLLASKAPSKDQSVGRASKEYMAPYMNKDFPAITSWYRVILILSVVGDMLVMAGPSAPAQSALVSTSIVIHCLQCVFQLRSLGCATTRQAAAAMALIMLGTKVFGHTTVYCGLWYWRENVIYGLSK
ncbi:hypothetical protein AU210_007122 [Fusarium oxysporum f. sp. radicis-cucumerinum]|uniref:FAD-binding domain-containing protein n=2 Tax=Fusarium oxysporum TaxID=5507 RepID=A0A2H3H7L8_FUSOX|nr:hypothetical protein AU210_007122 [Fusarium oxysporum f. sp. radicis-cucumerinum]RKK90356.1 hypothetical protein BFJ71_g11656 [Fusarium oxysporum]RKL07926.1 hypothetical protein BFJ68_g9725 [Fusarium oxysporum]